MDLVENWFDLIKKYKLNEIAADESLAKSSTMTEDEINETVSGGTVDMTADSDNQGEEVSIISTFHARQALETLNLFFAQKGKEEDKEMRNNSMQYQSY